MNAATTVQARRRWPWIIAAMTVALALLPIASPDPVAETFAEIAAMVILISATILLTVVGALLATRVGDNPIGYLLLAAGFLIVGSSLADLYGTIDASAQSDRPLGAELARVSGEMLFIYGIVIALVIVPLVFPTGRLLGPRWRWVVWITVAGMASLTLATALGPEALDEGARSSSLGEGARVPLGSSLAVGAVELLQALNAITAFVGLGAAGAATVIRLRRSRGIEQQQMKWLAAVASVAALTMPLGLVVPNEAASDTLFLIALTAFAFLPVAIGVAVLRYRLYEIDRLISRTIGWVLVTGMLVGAFALLVIGSGALLEPLTGGNTLAVAGSTLIVVALFAPLRSRVQVAVDRRFDRSRYDGERTLEAFGERLRDEVDLPTIRTDVLATIETSVRPTRVGLWLRGSEEQA